MAEVAKKRKVLSMEDKVNMIKQIESGKKKADVYREFGLVNSTIQTIWRNRDKIVSAFEKKIDHKLNDYGSQNGVMWMKRC
jgi:transposase-like protein